MATLSVFPSNLLLCTNIRDKLVVYLHALYSFSVDTFVFLYYVIQEDIFLCLLVLDFINLISYLMPHLLL